MTIENYKLYCLNPNGFHRMHVTKHSAVHNARALICAHGFSRNGRDFDPLAQSLADSWQVYCPDAVGRGHSDWLTQREHYNYDQYLRDNATLVSHISAPLPDDAPYPAPGVDWIGTSMGGLVGMMLAAQPGTPLRRLVLNDIGAQISADALNRIGEYVRETPSFDTLAGYQAYLADIHAAFGPLSDAQWQHLAAHSHRVENERIVPHYDPAIASAFDQPIETDVDMWALWSAISVPTLVIRGSQSDLLTSATLERMVALKPDTQVLEIADAGHAPALMRASEIAAIRAFLADPSLG